MTRDWFDRYEPPHPKAYLKHSDTLPLRVETVVLGDCSKCRSQIEQETRQKCWEDMILIVKGEMSIQTYSKIKELKQKWGVK